MLTRSKPCDRQDSFWLGLKLTYREGTPSDYEPAGFVKSSNGLKFATQPIRLGVGPNIRTRHNSLGVDLYAEEAEGLESCDHIGQHIPTGGWGIDLSRLGPRTSQGDDTRQASSEEDKVVAEARCARPQSNTGHRAGREGSPQHACRTGRRLARHTQQLCAAVCCTPQRAVRQRR